MVKREHGGFVRKKRFRIDVQTRDGVIRILRLASTNPTRWYRYPVKITWQIFQQKRSLTVAGRQFRAIGSNYKSTKPGAA